MVDCPDCFGTGWCFKAYDNETGEEVFVTQEEYESLPDEVEDEDPEDALKRGVKRTKFMDYKCDTCNGEGTVSEEVLHERSGIYEATIAAWEEHQEEVFQEWLERIDHILHKHSY